VFSELFVMLEGYFLRGKLDLTEMLDKFFNQLYQKMFTVINSQYNFNDE
jgi:glypican 4 (K-glypican)